MGGSENAIFLPSDSFSFAFNINSSRIHKAGIHVIAATKKKLDDMIVQDLYGIKMAK